MNCVAFQFADLTASGDPASLANLSTSGLTPGQYDTMETEAPCIMIYDGVGGYKNFYYISDAYDAGGNEVTAWANFSGDEATGVVASAGTGFCIRSSAAGKLAFSK